MFRFDHVFHPGPGGEMICPFLTRDNDDRLATCRPDYCALFVVDQIVEEFEHYQGHCGLIASPGDNNYWEIKPKKK